MGLWGGGTSALVEVESEAVRKPELEQLLEFYAVLPRHGTGLRVSNEGDFATQRQPERSGSCGDSCVADAACFALFSR